MMAADLIRISVTQPGRAEATSLRRIDEFGTIRLPQKEGRYKVHRATVGEAEAIIRAAYPEGTEVRVSIEEARSKRFSVMREGDRGLVPADYALPRADFRLLDAVVAARSVALSVDTLRVIRRTTDGDNVSMRLIEIPYARLLAGDMRLNIVVHPGDLILIGPEATVYPSGRFDIRGGQG